MNERAKQVQFKFPSGFRIVSVLTLAAGTAILYVSLTTGIASADSPNPPNCMAVDMGTWAREGSAFFDFERGSGWGQFVAGNAQDPGLFGTDNLGQAMVNHLDGDYFGVPGVSCQP